jgi:hypothetical protein
MKNKALVFLFLVLVSPYFGWAKGRAQAAAAQEEELNRLQAGQAFPNTGSPTPTDPLEQRMVFPQHPVTRPLLEMIYRVNNDIKGIPYFLSDSVTLEYSKTTQNLEISERGEVTLREVTLQNRVYVDKNTSGILSAVSYDAEGRMLLAINFDENDDSYPLIFREEGRDRAFYLVHYVISGRDKKMYYGQVLYDLQTGLGDSIPRLQIPFEEVEELRPSMKTLQGHRISFRPAEDGL